MCQSNFDIPSRSKGFLKSFTALFFLIILGCQEEQPRNSTDGIQETVTNAVIAQDAPPIGDFEFYDLEPLPLEDMKLVSYSKDFSQRIGMPLEDAEENMPAGLHAIEFSVERYTTPTANFYTCHLKMYVDSDLDIWFPGDSSVGNGVVVGARHFFQNTREKRLALQEVDRARLSSLENSYRGKAYLVISDGSSIQGSARTWLTYLEHYQDFIDEVDYLNLNFDCAFLGLYPEFSDQPIQVWIEKIGGRDYTQSFDIDPEDFIIFAIPSDFKERASLPMALANERNSEIRNRRYKSPRRL